MLHPYKSSGTFNVYGLQGKPDILWINMSFTSFLRKFMLNTLKMMFVPDNIICFIRAHMIFFQDLYYLIIYKKMTTEKE